MKAWQEDIKENINIKVKLSIIIVSYNVRYFLEQCLISTKIAINELNQKYGNNSAEILVVDNNSADDSCEMIKHNFPEVKLIENKTNTGFSTANNQAISIANGKYVLLLNPDTFVNSDIFVKVIDFLDTKPQAGGLGVKMIDGFGRFQPESKRGLPTPMTSLFKITGLAKLCKESKIYGRYYMSYLPEDEINEIEILSGAVMFMKKSVLDEIGFLDETFFMYGEDIDLSYRIIKSGYKNYYFPKTNIIHYKGESTKKNSSKYVKAFYGSMIIFAKKHFFKSKINPFVLITKIAVFFLSIIAYLKNLLYNLFKNKQKNHEIVIISNQINSEQIISILNKNNYKSRVSVYNNTQIIKKLQQRKFIKKTIFIYDVSLVEISTIFEIMKHSSTPKITHLNYHRKNNFIIGNDIILF